MNSQAILSVAAHKLTETFLSKIRNIASMSKISEVSSKLTKSQWTGVAIMLVTGLLLATLIVIQQDIQLWGLTLCEAFASNPNLEMAQCPVHSSNVSWMLNLSFVFAILTMCSGLYLIFANASASPKEDIKLIPKIKPQNLDEEEKKIYEIVQTSGSAYQSDMIKQTEFSKVKVTRILDKLESKGLIERKRRGMTNIIILK